MRFVRWTVLVLCSLAVSGGASWLFWQGRSAARRASPKHARRHGRPIPVRTVLVTQSSVDEVVGATAVTEPSQTASIRIGANRLSPSREFKATAVLIKQVRVTDGAYVEEGDTLFELDDEFLQQVVKQRGAEFTAATAELELVKQSTTMNQRVREMELASAEANLKFRTEALKSHENLLQSVQKLHERDSSTALEVLQAKAAVSQATFDLTEARYRFQRATDASTMGTTRDTLEIEVSTAKFHGAKFALEISQKDLLACQIRSPTAGFATSISVVPGEVIDSSAELTKVLTLDPIFVRVDFPQERIDDVSLNLEAEVVLDSYPKETFRGTVVRIAPQANAQLRVIPVTVKLSNPKNRIKSGLSGFARIHVNKAAVVIPSAAVVERTGRAMTFCVEDGRARIREIVTGPIVENGWVEIKSGLEPGNEVVLYDMEELQDGDAVDVDWRKWARRD